MPRQDNDHWSVERKVNLGFLAALTIQTVGFLTGAAWYAAKVDARLAALETTDVRILVERDQRRAQVESRFEAIQKDRDRLIRVETQIDGIARSLGRIEGILIPGPR